MKQPPETGNEVAAALESHEEFMRRLRHDLRAPLNAIAIGAELLRRRLEREDPRDPEALAEPLKRINENVRRMAEMLDEWRETSDG